MCRAQRRSPRWKPNGGLVPIPEALRAALSRVGDADALLKTTQFGSCVFANKPGDGSAREQAASCQKVLGGLCEYLL